MAPAKIVWEYAVALQVVSDLYYLILQFPDRANCSFACIISKESNVWPEIFVEFRKRPDSNIRSVTNLNVLQGFGKVILKIIQTNPSYHFYLNKYLF